jgi:hypothetical protein
VVRRVFSAHGANTTELVARVGAAEFRRDGGSEVAFRLVNTTTGDIDVDCHGVNIGGTPVGKRMTVAAGDDPLVLTGANGFGAFTCQFLERGTATPHYTQVTLQNDNSGALWVGTVLSTDDQ